MLNDTGFFSREFVELHREALGALLERTHRIAFWMFILTFSGYGLALWVWWSGNAWAALIIATLSYLFFRQFRVLSFGLARTALRGQSEAQAMLGPIDRALEHGKVTSILAELDAHLAALDSLPQQPTTPIPEEAAAQSVLDGDTREGQGQRDK